MGILSCCEPQIVFDYFEYLSSVPHGSGNTKAVSDLCVRFAEEHGLKVTQDAVNNVVIFKPASKGYEQAEPIILQGHLDMVCAKTADCPMDMEREPIQLATDGEWIWAKNTSLGGDDIVAGAIMLSILADDTLPHPALEAVFTVDEETNMGGASALDLSQLKGRRLLNLDSEEEGVVTSGCAGGVCVYGTIPARWELIGDGWTVLSADISGLLGGHSGVDIDKGHASSNQLMSRFLYAVLQKMPLRLCALDGGTMENVIPLHTQATFCVPQEKAEAVRELAEQYQTFFAREYAAADPGVCLTLTDGAAEDAVCAADSETMVLSLLLAPQGVQEMSMDIPGLVQTSVNQGPLHLQQESLHLHFLIRSSFESQKKMVAGRVAALISRMGGCAEQAGDYPCWTYRRESDLRTLFCEVFHEQTGKEAVVSATHGGLECGLFCDGIPNLDCISVGPEIRDIHSVHERLNVKSTAELYKIVCEMLRRCR